MDVIHSYILPQKREDANCATCRFAKVSKSIDHGDVLICRERMYDPKTLKCYLPKEENADENP